MNEHKKGEDVSSMVGDLKVSDKLHALSKRYLFLRTVLIASVIIILVLISGIYIIWSQVKNYQTQQKLQYQMLYNINKSAFSDKRKDVATLWLANLFLRYYPRWQEQQLAKVVDLIYEEGERKYGIPCEFWGTLIVYESDCNPNAKSVDGALGLMQLMPATASYLAPLVGITYRGNVTRRNPLHNVKMGMKYYYDLHEEYGFKYAVTGYNWGEGTTARWKRQGKIEHLTYYHEFLKEKIMIEEALGEKYNIPYIEPKDYAYVSKKYYEEKLTKLRKKVDDNLENGGTNK